MFLHLLWLLPYEREFIVHSGASLHLTNKSDVIPKEQGTIQKSKDPSVIMTENGTAHTTEEATVCICVVDMFVQVQFLKESLEELSFDG